MVFLTGLKEDKKLPHEQAQKDLSELVEGIDDQFSDVLERHERDFLNAYKVTITIHFLGTHG
jgi:hypothetical protein